MASIIEYIKATADKRDVFVWLKAPYTHDDLIALAESHERLVREATDFLQGGPEIDRDEPAKKLWAAIKQAEALTK